MPETMVFRTGWVKRALGWFVILASAAALAALLYNVATHWEALPPSEMWSALAIGLFILAFLVMGIAIQHVRWSIDRDTITLHHLFRTRAVRVSELAGFGQTIVIVGLFPIAHVDLYDANLKPVRRLPIGLKDWPVAEAWLSKHLRRVVDDGSPALPKRRFADAPIG